VALLVLKGVGFAFKTIAFAFKSFDLSGEATVCSWRAP
jgi:hypothetical protein